MFDLKQKLLAKGLVTKEQIDKVTADKKIATNSEAFSFEAKDRKRKLEDLKAQSKAEQYVTIRKWVDINRLDKSTHAYIGGERFFIPGKDNQISWLTLPSDVVMAIKDGQAGVIAYMSNHGLTHAVVPRDIAEDVALVFPDWLRVLNDKT